MDGQMTGHLQRIQAVEKEVARLNGATALKEEVTKLRSEMKKLHVSCQTNPRTVTTC
jgi:hypothetical protein